MAWRMNRRALSPQDRINELFAAVEGRLAYQTLIGAIK
jgi:hypothetical protein